MDGYFHKARIALLVYDVMRIYTLNSVPEWYALAINKGLDPNEVIFLLIENKVDLEEYREVPPDAGERLARKLNLHGFVRTSALTGYNVELAFKEAVTKLVELIIKRVKNNNRLH